MSISQNSISISLLVPQEDRLSTVNGLTAVVTSTSVREALPLIALYAHRQMVAWHEDNIAGIIVTHSAESASLFCLCRRYLIRLPDNVTDLSPQLNRVVHIVNDESSGAKRHDRDGEKQPRSKLVFLGLSLKILLGFIDSTSDDCNQVGHNHLALLVHIYRT